MALTGGAGDSQGYPAGTISGFSKSGATSLDLQDIGYTPGVTTATFSGTSTGGVLTVTNGSQTANISLAGDYLASTFTVLTDGHGGTIVADPPAGRSNSITAPVHRLVAAAAAMG